MLYSHPIPIFLNEPDCTGIELANWYDANNLLDAMEINLGSDDQVKQQLLTFTGKTNEDVVVLQFCLGVVVKVSLGEYNAANAEADYLTVADGEIVLTAPDSNTFETAKLG